MMNSIEQARAAQPREHMHGNYRAQNYRAASKGLRLLTGPIDEGAMVHTRDLGLDVLLHMRVLVQVLIGCYPLVTAKPRAEGGAEA